MAVFSVFWTGAATFLSSSSSVVLTRLSGPRIDEIQSYKIIKKRVELKNEKHNSTDRD
jgi:hypothetical protein